MLEEEEEEEREKKKSVNDLIIPEIVS